MQSRYAHEFLCWELHSQMHVSATWIRPWQASRKGLISPPLRVHNLKQPLGLPANNRWESEGGGNMESNVRWWCDVTSRFTLELCDITSRFTLEVMSHFSKNHQKLYGKTYSWLMSLPGFLWKWCHNTTQQHFFFTLFLASCRNDINKSWDGNRESPTLGKKL